MCLSLCNCCKRWRRWTILNVHYRNLHTISIHVESINLSFFKLSFMKQANVFGCGRAKVVYLKKTTKNRNRNNRKLSPALSFYGSLWCTYAQTALLFLVKVNKRDFVLEMGQYLTWWLNYFEFSLYGFIEQRMCGTVRCLHRTQPVCTETNGLL